MFNFIKSYIYFELLSWLELLGILLILKFLFRIECLLFFYYYFFCLFVLLVLSSVSEMESTLQEERSLKLQVEAKLLQLEKEHSMLDCDYKREQHKLDELQAQKEKLHEEVSFFNPYGPKAKQK